MPIYEYQCQNCGHELEALQKIADAPLQECPECHKDSLKKKVSAAAFRLKGGGWYETDFKTGDKRNLHGDSGGKTAGKKDKKDSGKSAAAAKQSGSTTKTE